MKKVELIIVDPQYDFCSPNGSLYVNKAEDDMLRLSKMIINNVERITNLSITLDQHHSFQIFHPIFWQNRFKNNPKPYTQITLDDLEKKIWLPTDIRLLGWCEHYLRTLMENGEFSLTIWPPHCIIGTRGATIFEPINVAKLHFETEQLKPVSFYHKGENYLTEHYSAIEANVPVMSDKRTQHDRRFLASINAADVVLISGEALSHCVANTVIDIAKHIGNDLSKVILLIDTMSSVTGFEDMGQKFLEKAKELGISLSTTETIFKEI